MQLRRLLSQRRANPPTGLAAPEQSPSLAYDMTRGAIGASTGLARIAPVNSRFETEPPTSLSLPGRNRSYSERHSGHRRTLVGSVVTGTSAQRPHGRDSRERPAHHSPPGVPAVPARPHRRASFERSAAPRWPPHYARACPRSHTRPEAHLPPSGAGPIISGGTEARE